MTNHLPVLVGLAPPPRKHIPEEAYRKVRMLHIVDILVKLGQHGILSTHFEVFSSQQLMRFQILAQSICKLAGCDTNDCYLRYLTHARWDGLDTFLWY
jgi:hypothetical protein